MIRFLAFLLTIQATTAGIAQAREIPATILYGFSGSTFVLISPKDGEMHIIFDTVSCAVTYYPPAGVFRGMATTSDGHGNGSYAFFSITVESKGYEEIRRQPITPNQQFQLFGFIYNPADGYFYTQQADFHGNLQGLRQIDPHTSQILDKLVSLQTDSGGLGQLTFDPKGNLWGISHSQSINLVKFNFDTGRVVYSVPLAGGENYAYSSFAFDPETDTLYGIRLGPISQQSDSWDFGTINVGTGEFTVIRTFHGLANFPSLLVFGA